MAKNKSNTSDVSTEKEYSKNKKDLLKSSRHVEAVSKEAASQADFFAPERGKYIQGLNQLMTGGQSATASDPSYQFRFNQGQKALESSLAAQGMLSSGRAALELRKYGQELASTEFQDQYQRLMSLAGVGQSNPAASAQLMYLGSKAPFQAASSIAKQVFDSAQADKDRSAKLEAMRMRHMFDLENMRYKAELDRSRNEFEDSVESGYGGGGVSSGYQSWEDVRAQNPGGTLLPPGDTYLKNLGVTRKQYARGKVYGSLPARQKYKGIEGGAIVVGKSRADKS